MQTVAIRECVGCEQYSVLDSRCKFKFIYADLFSFCCSFTKNNFAIGFAAATNVVVVFVIIVCLFVRFGICCYCLTYICICMYAYVHYTYVYKNELVNENIFFCFLMKI